MKFGAVKIFSKLILLLLGGLLLAGLNFVVTGVQAAELGFSKAEGQMVFTIPYADAPEINALFVDSGTEVALTLPAGIKLKLQQHKLDDEWITAFGIERVGNHLRWYLKKRDPILKVKSFLALERQKTELKVVLLKPYRQWQTTANTDENSALQKVLKPAAAGEQEKLDRLNRLLENPGSDGAVKSLVPETGANNNSAPSLLVSAIRSFGVLIFLVLVIFGLSIWFKRYRQKGGRILGSSLVKVLSVEVVSGKHQVMLLELLDEVLVVGVCGERMTLLTTVSDPGRVEELRQLHGEPNSSGSKRGFAGYLQVFMGKDSLSRERNSNQNRSVENPGAGINYPPAAASSQTSESLTTSAESDELPENYREVVSQIKNRLQKGDRG